MKKIELSDFDAIAFDLEGTLADTIPTHHHTRLEAFEQHGLGHITKDQHALGSTYGSSHFDILGGVLLAAGEIDSTTPFHRNQMVLDIIATKGRLFKAAADNGFEAMPGAIDFIKSIAPFFIGKMAIVTSSEEEFIFPFINRFDLSTYFPNEHIIGHESVIQEGLGVKPSGDPYLLAMKHLGTANLLVFEDTVSGVASAKKAGAFVVALGFEENNRQLFERGGLEYPPDLYVKDYTEAKALLGMN